MPENEIKSPSSYATLLVFTKDSLGSENGEINSNEYTDSSNPENSLFEITSEISMISSFDISGTSNVVDNAIKE